MAHKTSNRNNLRSIKGFTMIELVVVIILLGILAATALPRFIDVDSEAHNSVVESVQGGLQTGIAMFHAKWVAQGEPAADTQMGADFSNLRTNANGYPYGLVANGGQNVSTADDCVAVYQNVLQAGAPSIGAASSTGDVTGSLTDVTAVAAAPNCSFYYTAENNSAGQEVPLLTYTSADGTLTRSTFTLP